jgi:S-DNA-T family DNA segregation ATPase FtsK/SpoIIIE
MFGRKNKKSEKSRDPAKPKESGALGARLTPIQPFWGLLGVAIGILTLLACFGYKPGQDVYLTWLMQAAGSAPTSRNPVGTLGATYAALSNWLAGDASLILVPAFALWIGGLFLFRRGHAVRWWKFLVMIFVLLSAAGLADMLFVWRSTGPSEYFPYGYGGYAGHLLYSVMLAQPLGHFGSAILLGLVYGLGLLLIFTENPVQSVEWWVQEFAAWRERKAEAKRLRQVEWEKQKNARALAALKPVPSSAAPLAAAKTPSVARTKETREEEPAPPSTHGTFKVGDNLTLFSDGAQVGGGETLTPEQVAKLSGAATPPKSRTPRQAQEDSAKPGRGVKIIAEEAVEKAAPTLPSRKGDYIFPTLDLLAPPEQRQTDSAEFHEERAEQLVRTLAEFGVKVHPTEIHAGPVITRYEVTPAPGVRVEKIVNLDKNLALALKAEGVRIIAPVPGKGTVGIEVPNRQPASVCLREIIESRAWADSKSEIPVVLGKDVTGKPIVTDLTKMPHALIAGSTGAGKTVCINTIIASLLFKMSPDDLRFIMVDPKIVEMQIYNDLPHMLVPVVTDPKKVPAALKFLIREMEHRYKIFAQIGARNIAGFNAKILRDKDQEDKAEELDAEMTPEERAAAREISVPRDAGVIEIEKKRLPYIVCIIDELADLMMVAPADIETCVARLAQLARAAGIHLILATQRPSVNVITGVIKANLPCRIAFKVASKVDSRTILDTGGADTLIGRGDMLFVPPGSANLVRAQGAFVSDDEINSIVEFLKRNGPPEFDDNVQAQIEAGDGEEGEGGDDDDEGWDDNLVPQALEVLRATKRASTSMLQRRLKIGYNRAARIMEALEAEGIVGPENGSSPREILKDLDNL